MLAICKVNKSCKQEGLTFVLSPIRHSINFEIIQVTGLSKSHVSRAIRELKERYIIIQSGNKLVVNKEVSQWH